MHKSPIISSQLPAAWQKFIYRLIMHLFPGAVELRNALSTKFGVELPPTVTLDYPSVAALASHLAAQLPTGGSPAVEEPEPSELDDDSNSEVTHQFI